MLFSSMSSWQLHYFFSYQRFWKYCNNPAAELVQLMRNWFRYPKTINLAQRFVASLQLLQTLIRIKKDWQNLEKYFCICYNCCTVITLLLYCKTSKISPCAYISLMPFGGTIFFICRTYIYYICGWDYIWRGFF